MPAQFTLAQNYPNPFNPETRIQFSVAQSGRAVLRGFNLIGREVATIHDGVAEEGRLYTVMFNGSKLSSGTYIYKLESNNQTLTRKFVAQIVDRTRARYHLVAGDGVTDVLVCDRSTRGSEDFTILL